MSLVLPPKTDIDFELPPADTHLAVCYRVIDLGTQFWEFKGTPQKGHKIMLSWELSECFMTQGKNEGLPFSIHKRYTFSSSKKSNLRKDLESWRGVPFSDEDFGSFDLGRLLGVPCFLGIVHEEKNGKTYSNISSIMKVPKGYAAKPPVNPTVYFSFGEFDQTTFDNLSENLRNTLSNTPEYKQLKGINSPTNISDDWHDDSDQTPF